MTKERLLTLLANLGQSSPDGLAWLAGEGHPGGRALFVVPMDSLQAALNGAVGGPKAKNAQPFDPAHFFDLVATEDGEILSLAEIKERKDPKGSCLLITLRPLEALSGHQLSQVSNWDGLTRATQDKTFPGPLGEILRLANLDKAGAATVESSALAGGSCAAMATAVRPQLDTSVADIEATAEQLGINPADEPVSSGHKGVVDGTGVIVGVVDFGCDFAHPNFRMADGATRLLALWDQNDFADGQDSAAGGGFPGRIFGREEIDWALSPSHHSCPGSLAGKGEPPPYVEAHDHPYWRLGYDPHARHYMDVQALGGAHGTHVLDIAAGNGFAVLHGAPRNAGVAPGADIIFVQLAKEAGPQPGSALDLARLLMGVLYIFKEAEDRGRPAVVNISLNGNAGPHDGSTAFDAALDWLLQRPGRCVTVAAGNFRQQACHARRVLQSGDQTSFSWQFPAGDVTQNRVQFWADSDAAEVSLTAKVSQKDALQLPLKFRLQDLTDAEAKAVEGDGTRLPFGARAQVWLPSSSEAVLNEEHLEIGPPHRTRVGFASIRAVAPPPWAPAGKRRLVVTLWLEPLRIREVLSRHHKDGGEPADRSVTLDLSLYSDHPGGAQETLIFDGWIERDDFRIDESGSNQGHQSRFAHAQEMHSLGSLSCGQHSVVVGAYYDTAEDRALWHHSSLGPTRLGGSKPDVSAPGRLIHAARSKGFRLRYPGTDSPWRTSATIAFSGTSMAAPHVAGVAALLLQIDPELTGAEIGQLLQETVQDKGGLDRWHHGLGYGRVSAATALAKALAKAPQAKRDAGS
ncbi:MAG: S8 family serine peptidase [Kiloniellales bacterium]